MKTIRRLFFSDIVSSVAFVALAFLSLFFFIDFVQELGDLGARGYTALHALLYCVLQIPGHLYELAPIAVLIGTIYTLARMAQSSEFTILRTAGLGPARALSLLASLGLAFGLLTFVVGDYLAPATERLGTELRANFRGSLDIGRSGAWLKDRQSTPSGERSYSIHVASTGSRGELKQVRIFEFDEQGRLVRRIFAESASVDRAAVWTLNRVAITRWPAGSGNEEGAAPDQAASEKLLSMQWASTLSADVVTAAVMPLNTMSTIELARYVAHLSENEQAAQRHEIQFWKRALYPLACLVMVGLALPFAYMHTRGGQGISFKVFGGIMLGISFVLLNNLASHLGLLQNWTPWMVAATPSVFYLLLSMAAFTWLIRYR